MCKAELAKVGLMANARGGIRHTPGHDTRWKSNGVRTTTYKCTTPLRNAVTSGNRSWPCRRAPRPRDAMAPTLPRPPASTTDRHTGRASPASGARSDVGAARRPRLKYVRTFARRVSTSTPDFVRLNLAYRGPGFCTCFVRSLSRQREDPDRYAGSARCVLVPRPRVVYRSRVRS